MTALPGKTAIVTGAASGQGEATAIMAAAAGMHVVCVDVDDPTATVEASGGSGGSAVGVRGDTSDVTTWHEAVAAAVDLGAGIHLLANVAGITPLFDGLVESSDETWHRTLDVNLKSVWLGMRAVLPTMVDQGGGRIVNVASLAATHGVGGLSSYSASKSGVAGLTRQAAVDYGKAGVRVNAINPGVIDTPMNAGNPPDMQAAFLEKTPVGRAGRAEEVAATILFLASPLADFITGQSLGVDGGWSIQS